jgi:hypothetical protein
LRIKGEWVLGDWPPVVPVIDFDRIVVAGFGKYHKMEDGVLKLDTTSYDAFAIGAPAAAILVQRHECDAITRYRGHMTEAGRRRLEEFKQREAEGA